jgi:hypothetical protein
MWLLDCFAALAMTKGQSVMPVYTVHAPKSAGQGPLAATDKFVFVRDGFHFWAFVAGPFWLLAHRLWLALLGYLVLSFVGEIALSKLGVGVGLRGIVMLLVALLMGFEGASLRRWSLSSGSWRQLDVVVADNPEAAERRFFDRWPAHRQAESIDRGAPPPARSYRASSADEVIGLFPQPGVTR